MLYTCIFNISINIYIYIYIYICMYVYIYSLSNIYIIHYILEKRAK